MGMEDLSIEITTTLVSFRWTVSLRTRALCIDKKNRLRVNVKGRPINCNQIWPLLILTGHTFYGRTLRVFFIWYILTGF